MSNDATPVSTWATGSNETWTTLKKGFKHLSVEYAALGDKASQEVSVTANLFLDFSDISVGVSFTYGNEGANLMLHCL